MSALKGLKLVRSLRPWPNNKRCRLNATCQKKIILFSDLFIGHRRIANTIQYTIIFVGRPLLKTHIFRWHSDKMILTFKSLFVSSLPLYRYAKWLLLSLPIYRRLYCRAKPKVLSAFFTNKQILHFGFAAEQFM